MFTFKPDNVVTKSEPNFGRYVSFPLYHCITPPMTRRRAIGYNFFWLWKICRLNPSSDHDILAVSGYRARVLQFKIYFFRTGSTWFFYVRSRPVPTHEFWQEALLKVTRTEPFMINNEAISQSSNQSGRQLVKWIEMCYVPLWNFQSQQGGSHFNLVSGVSDLWILIEYRHGADGCGGVVDLL